MMEKKRKTTKATGKRKVGRPSLPEDAKHTKHLGFGLRDTHFQEFLELKEKWGIRDLADAARRVWLAGLEKLRDERGTPPSSE